MTYVANAVRSTLFLLQRVSEKMSLI